MNVPILLPVHNRIRVTQTGLASLFKAISFYNSGSSIYNFSVILIDDGSTDGTANWAQTNFSCIYIIKGDGNLWWSGAINKGIEFSLKHFDSIMGFLLWNDDLEIKEDYFLKLSSIISNSQYKDTIIASTVYYKDIENKIFFQGGYFNFKNGNGYIINKDKIDTLQNTTVTDCQYTGGMGVFIPAAVIEKVGILDNKSFPQYHGDIDFALRAIKKGFHIICHSDIKVWNDRQQTYKTQLTSLSVYFKSLVEFRSNYNIKRDIKFYTKHVQFPYSVFMLMRKHMLHFRKALKSIYEKY